MSINRPSIDNQPVVPPISKGYEPGFSACARVNTWRRLLRIDIGLYVVFKHELRGRRLLRLRPTPKQHATPTAVYLPPAINISTIRQGSELKGGNRLATRAMSLGAGFWGQLG